jgi:hypothetical protein
MNLYSRRKFLASVALLACAVALASAAPQRRKPHQLRATAVLEITTDSAGIVSTHVIPVTILDEGRFHDAGIYKATPRPMALDNGIVYEAQVSGVPTGYATIFNGVNDHGWTAIGKWQPIEAVRRPAAAPVVKSDERPIIRRGDAPPPPPEPTPASNTAPPPEDADRPVLKRRVPEKTEAASAPTPQAQPTPQEGAVPATRPSLYTPGTKTLVGVSDNESTDPRSYDFKWKAGEEEQMHEKMVRLALAQLPRESAQVTAGSLKNLVMRSFDLDMSNDAVIVLSAEAPGSYLAPGSKTAASAKFVSRYITVIARVDFEGVPQKLTASVTDSSRLDVAPRLELIDAVDVDGDGPAELLFREYSFDQKSFIIYGVGRSSVTKVFEGASTPLNAGTPPK